MQIFKVFRELPKVKNNNSEKNGTNNEVKNNKYGVIRTRNLESELKRTKSKLDRLYLNKNAGKIMRLFDPFAREKYIISKKINAPYVTNAWLKCYELLHRFQLIPSQGKFVYFDNAAFPGSFILATNHYVKTLTKCDMQWYASSLISGNALNDSYDLYKNYPNNWLMHDQNNGDLSNWSNILDFCKQISNGTDERRVDLYTCDLGMDVSKNYNEQESIHSHLNICQIACGIKVLKIGGSMIVKHYTLFKGFTQYYIDLLTLLFDNVYITKPITSRRTNSETYIVCINFNGNFGDAYDKIIHMSQVSGEIQLPSTYGPNLSQKSIQLANISIFGNQIKSLNIFVKTFYVHNKLLKLNKRTPLKPIYVTNKNIKNRFRAPLVKINQGDNLAVN
jgi:hypothetical protein